MVHRHYNNRQRLYKYAVEFFTYAASPADETVFLKVGINIANRSTREQHKQSLMYGETYP